MGYLMFLQRFCDCLDPENEAANFSETSVIIINRQGWNNAEESSYSSEGAF